PADPHDAGARALLDTGRRTGRGYAEVDPAAQAPSRSARAQALRKGPDARRSLGPWIPPDAAPPPDSREAPAHDAAPGPRTAGNGRHREKDISRREKERRRNGGAEGNRTPDLIIANDALSQLSYSPVRRLARI